jgi:hypothetical protein
VKKMKKGLIRQILVVITVVGMIVVNALANILPFNNVSTKEISDSFKVFFVPAAYVFSIWGLIYLGLVAYAIFQALPSQRDNPRLKRIALPFIVNGVANGLWLYKWHHRDFLSTLLLMLVVLVSLIMIYLILGTGREQKVTKAETWLVRIPFSIYLGWITVATIANVTDVLYFYNWNGWGIAPQVWSVIMLGVAVIVGGLMAYTRRDAAYLSVLVWAFAGIAVKFQGTEPVFTAALVAAIAAALLMIYSLIPRKRAMAA